MKFLVVREVGKELLRGERKAGRQPGHRGAGRELRPEDQVDEIVDHYPVACRGCGREFSADERRPGGRFGRHHVCELPPISMILVEHRTHWLGCGGCGFTTTAGVVFLEVATVMPAVLLLVYLSRVEVPAGAAAWPVAEQR